MSLIRSVRVKPAARRWLPRFVIQLLDRVDDGSEALRSRHAAQRAGDLDDRLEPPKPTFSQCVELCGCVVDPMICPRSMDT